MPEQIYASSRSGANVSRKCATTSFAINAWWNGAELSQNDAPLQVWLQASVTEMDQYAAHQV